MGGVTRWGGLMPGFANVVVWGFAFCLWFGRMRIGLS